MAKRLPTDWILDEARFVVDGSQVVLNFKTTNHAINLSAPSQEEFLKKALLAKDNALLNDAGYHELKMVPGSAGLPSLSCIKKKRKRQNGEIPIEPVHMEGHQELRDCMKDVFHEMKDLECTGLDFDGRHFNIEWLVCSDWTFLAIFLGLSGAKAKYFCIWCFCSKDKIVDFLGKICSIIMIRKAMHDTGVNFYFFEVKGDDGKSSIKWSSLDGNELNKVLEKLNLKAVLNDMTNKTLSTLDILNKTSLMNLCKERDLPTSGTKEALKSNLKDWMKKNGVHSLASKTLPYSSFSMMNRCTDPSNRVQPDNTNPQTSLIVDKLVLLWKDFSTLMMALRANPGDEAYMLPDNFHERGRQWDTNFRYVTFDEDVTPYIHVLVYHCHQFLEKYGKIHSSNCQPVENKNHIIYDKCCECQFSHQVLFSRCLLSVGTKIIRS
ncbi:uncharacterized protein [Montipora foliosa]|uniref:uncharacterized protein n=1 Tax=Montipora foliosa TaxID=591990 RepID=UPI0035F153CF